MLQSFPVKTPPDPFENGVLKGPRIIRVSATSDFTTVVERRADQIAGARGPACLIFSTDLGFTRVWSYPPDWDNLPDDELLALAERPRG
jgi:hypothetical protein